MSIFRVFAFLCLCLCLCVVIVCIYSFNVHGLIFPFLFFVKFCFCFSSMTDAVQQLRGFGLFSGLEQSIHFRMGGEAGELQVQV